VGYRLALGLFVQPVPAAGEKVPRAPDVNRILLSPHDRSHSQSPQHLRFIIITIIDLPFLLSLCDILCGHWPISFDA